MPESTEIMKKQKYYSSDSSCESSSSSSESDENEKEDYEHKKGDKQVTYNLKHSSHYKLIQQSSKSVSYTSVGTMKNYETEIVDLRKKSLGQTGPHLVQGDLVSVYFRF